MRADRNIIMVALAAILYGGITAVGDLLIGKGLSVYEISLCSILVCLASLAPYLLLHRNLLVRREHFAFYMLYGLIGAVLQLSSFTALFLGVPVAIVAVLLNTQPVWTTIIGHFWLREEAGRQQLTVMAIALVGLFILLEPWHAGHMGNMTGIMLSLLSGLCLSLWVILGRRGGMEGQHCVTISFGFLSSTGISLLILYPILLLFTSDERLMRLSLAIPLENILPLLVYIFIANLLPHLLFYRGIEKVKAVTAGMLLLLEPVSAALIAGLLFGEQVTVFMAAGGILILFSNYFILGKS